MSPRARRKPEVEFDPDARDFVMARLAAARVSAAAAIMAIDETIVMFVDVEEDEDGADRTDAIAAALEEAGRATRALEAAEERMSKVDPQDCEPWDTDEDDEEPAELPRATARERS